jgi:putative membrane protein
MLMNDEKTKYRGSLLHMIFKWQLPTAMLCLLCGALVAVLHHFDYLPAWLQFPSFPLAVIGGALGIFVSFRTNSCYQRWWEGRKLWGRLINTSRHVCTQALAYLPEAEAREAVHRQIAYVHALRCGLREQDPFEDSFIKNSMSAEELEILPGSTNLNHALINRQMRLFMRLNQDDTLNDFRLSDLDESMRHLLDIQGGAERIKKTPFPPAYGFLAIRLTQLYAILLPLCLVSDVSFWVIPANLLICMAFQLINEVGRALENPFTMFWPALPLSAMSITIERNLRQALGEAEIPDAQERTNHNRVLM